MLFLFYYLSRITLNSETWNREVCELIDYDSLNLNLEHQEIKTSGNLYRSENNSVIFTQEQLPSDLNQQLLNINYEDDNYDLIFNEYEQDEDGIITTHNSAWFLLKKNKIAQEYEKYKIHQGDIIKIGRIMTRIKEMKFEKKLHLNTLNNKNDNKNFSKYVLTTDNKSEVSELSLGSNKFDLKDIDNDAIIQKDNVINDNNNNSGKKNDIKDLAVKRNRTNSDLPEKVQILKLANNKDKPNIIDPNLNKKLKFNVKGKNNNEKVCRICYGEEDDPKENPIVQPCHCSGSCKYIHLNCLKHWIMTKSCIKIDDNEFCAVYIFSETECELCKAKLPDLLSHKGKLYNLLDFSEDFKNYLILECLTLDKENNKFIYIINLDRQGEIKIGRGQVCDILFSDASVSRVHCLFSVEGKNVFLKDYGSKFGTLVLIQTPIIKLAENLPLFIQVGRSFLNFKVTNDENKFFKCCGVSEKPLACYYYQQNTKQIGEKRIYTVKTEVDNDGNDNEINNDNFLLIDENNKSKNSNEIKININNSDENEIEIIEEKNDDVIDINKKGEFVEQINDA